MDHSEFCKPCILFSSVQTSTWLAQEPFSWSKCTRAALKTQHSHLGEVWWVWAVVSDGIPRYWPFLPSEALRDSTGCCFTPVNFWYMWLVHFCREVWAQAPIWWERKLSVLHTMVQKAVPVFGIWGFFWHPILLILEELISTIELIFSIKPSLGEGWDPLTFRSV
jgi:hypothetical protein